MDALTNKPARGLDAGEWVHRKVVTLLPGACGLLSPLAAVRAYPERVFSRSTYVTGRFPQQRHMRTRSGFCRPSINKPGVLRGATCGTRKGNREAESDGAHPVRVSTALITECSVGPARRLGRIGRKITGGLVYPCAYSIHCR